MFDFPANPSIGDTSNGYMFDGVGWAGGGPTVAAPVTEQFFDLSGKTLQDIPVPSWAKSVQLIGASLQSNGTYYPMVQVSADGTTFFTGATAYTYGGSVINSGSAGTTPATSDAPGLALSFVGDNSATGFPHLFTAELELSRPSTAATFTHKSYGKSYDSAATLNYRSCFIHGYVKQATTTALAIKALRVTTSGFGAGVTFTAGSYVKVAWLGNNSLAQAPAAGTVVLGKVWGTLTGSTALPTSSSIETAFANITVKSDTSRLIVSGGCFIGAAVGTLEHYMLLLQAPTGTQIQSNGGTNNTSSGIYVPLCTSGILLHAQPAGTVIRCASRVSRGAGTNAATVLSPWLTVEEIA